MARTHARLLTTTWQDEHFTELTVHEQWTFFMLISQADITNCGVLAYRPKRWARLAGKLHIDAIDTALDGLEARGMVVIDRETDELWIRSFVKNDGIMKHPNMIRSMRAAFEQVMSKPIRMAFLELYPQPETTQKDAIEMPSEPRPDGIETASRRHRDGCSDSRGVGVGVGVGDGDGVCSFGEEKKTRGTPLARDASEDRAPLKDVWLAAWKESHAGQDPPAGWIIQICQALTELSDPRPDLERIVAAHAREGKHPRNLVFVRNDFYADQARTA